MSKEQSGRKGKPSHHEGHGLPEPVCEGPIREEDIQGYHFLRKISTLLEHLRPCAQHPNRLLHYDQYAALLLLYFFNPAITSLRGIQMVSDMAKVRKRLGVRRTSLGAMSESVRVFDPELLRGVFEELAARAPHRLGDPKLAQVRQALTVADGTILPALPPAAAGGRCGCGTATGAPKRTCSSRC